jgi:O-antigen/teichoic acid export membrane protein
VIGTLAYQLTNLIVSYTVLPFRPRITFQHFREFYSFSAWLTAGQFVNTLNWRFEYLLIGKLLGPTPLGHYTVGNTLSVLPTREATAPLTQTIYPGFARLRDNPERLASAYQRAQSLLVALALPAGIGVAVIAEPLILLAMGEKWAPAIFIVQALAAVFALQTLGSLVQPLGMAKGETKLLFIRDCQMLVVRLPIIIGSLLLWGLPGVVYARVCTGLMSSVVNMFIVRRLVDVPVRRQLAANVRALAAAAMMALCVMAVGTFLSPTFDRLRLLEHVVLLVATGAAAYVGTSCLLWIAMKRPQGPETEIQRLVVKILSKAKRVALPGSA